MNDLLDRLDRHILIMAPHQKERRQGKLLAEARDELYRQAAIISRLRQEIHDLTQRTIRGD